MVKTLEKMVAAAMLATMSVLPIEVAGSTNYSMTNSAQVSSFNQELNKGKDCYDNATKARTNMKNRDEYLKCAFKNFTLSNKNSINKKDKLESLVGLGDTFKEMNLIDEAIDSFSQAIALEPNNSVLHYKLGDALIKKDCKKAIACYKKALKLNPNYADAMSAIGFAVEEENPNSVDGIKYYKKAIKLDPKNVSGRVNLGYDYMVLGKYDDAVNILQEAIKINSDHPNTHYILGLVYEKMGKKELAINSFENAAKLAPFASNYKDKLNELKK